MRFRPLVSLLLTVTLLIGLATPSAHGIELAQAEQLQISLIKTLDNTWTDSIAVAEPYAVSERVGKLIFYDYRPA